MDPMKGNLYVDSCLEQKAPDLPPLEYFPKLHLDGDDPAPETVSRGAEQCSVEGTFDLEQGLHKDANLPPPTIWAKIGWYSTLGKLFSPGQVHDFVKLSDDYEIKNAHYYLMEESMMPLCLRNVYLRKGWRQRFLKHDSVVVKIGDGLWIKAEKGGESRPLKNDGGIKLKIIQSSTHPKDWRDPGDVAPGRYGVRFELKVKGNVKFTWKQLKLILSPPKGANYNAFTANCWHYAFSITEAFLDLVLRNSEDEEVQGEIKQKLEELKLLERHFCNLRANSSSPKSRVT